MWNCIDTLCGVFSNGHEYVVIWHGSKFGAKIQHEPGYVHVYAVGCDIKEKLTETT